MNPNYHIRLARRDELKRINDIEDAASVLFADTKYAIEGELESLPINFLQQQLSEKRLWVAADAHDTPVGFALVILLDGNAHLHELSVHPEHGRQGLGTRLVRQVLSWAQQGGFPAVTLSTFRDIPWNAPFYRKLGFVEMAEAEFGPGLREIRQGEADTGLPMDDRLLMIYRFAPDR